MVDKKKVSGDSPKPSGLSRYGVGVDNGQVGSGYGWPIYKACRVMVGSFIKRVGLGHGQPINKVDRVELLRN